MLLVNSLTSNILSIFDKNLRDNNQIAFEIAMAYQTYASTAQGPIADAVILTRSEYNKVKEAVVSVINTRAPASVAASTIARGVMSFWLLPPIPTGGAGICASMIPAAGISKMMSTNVSSSPQAATALAEALHMMTKAVTVVYPPPLPPGFLW